MNELQVISGVSCYEENGTAYLKLDDVARGLGLTQTKNGVEYVKWERVTSYLREIGFSPEVGKECYIPENIFYRLAMKAKNETAEKFQALVADEIIPSIRKHGAYMTQDVLNLAINNPDFVIGLLQDLKAEQKARVEAERKNAILMHTRKTYTATEIAKELGFKSAIALNKDLCEKGIQYKINNTFVLYSQYADMGYVSIKQEILDSGKEVYNRRFTQEGRDFILSLYN